MKSLVKKILQLKLRFFSSLILKKYHPDVIAVTGSVGKTSTKEAIYAVLASTYPVRRNSKNYNNEIGVPLSIIGVESGGRSVLAWAAVFLRAMRLLTVTDRTYPQLLVLEMGADHPGDISYLLGFVPVKVGVVTTISEAHLEFFETVESIAREKGLIVQALPKNGRAILNYEDPLVHDMGKTSSAPVTYFGFSETAGVYATDVRVQLKDAESGQGVAFTLHADGQALDAFLPRSVGMHLISSALAAVAVGRYYDIDLVTMVKSLKRFEAPKGRMRFIAGIKRTFIIDDSYNSSPHAAEKAVEQLSVLPHQGKTYAVLGDMFELGRASEEAHYKLGTQVALRNIDYLVAVGERSRDIIHGALAAHMSKDRCFHFETSDEAGRFLQKRISVQDVLLVKGSQGVRMEKIVKELMAEPEKASELLVRQGSTWQ